MVFVVDAMFLFYLLFTVLFLGRKNGLCCGCDSFYLLFFPLDKK